MIKTVSLETAKKLKEAGFPQYKTYFWYGLSHGSITNNHKCHDRTRFEESYEAPSSDELLEQLPEIIKSEGKEKFWITIQKSNGLYCCFYENNWYEIIKFYHENESLPEALASMWLYLKKENLICQ